MTRAIRFALATALLWLGASQQAAVSAPASAAKASTANAAPSYVVTTTTDLKDIVRAIGGNRVEVDSLALPAQDPHTLELKPAHLARLEKADLVVRIGLDHEPWLAKMHTRALVVNLSQHVRLLQTDTPRLRAEARAHVHLFGNPHYWLDPENIPPMSLAIMQALSTLRPADQGYFEANQAAFLSKLKLRMKEWQLAMAPYAGTKVVVMHDSWAYFADRYQLAIVASAEPSPGIPPSPAELAALFARMRASSVRLVIANPDSNSALVEQVAQHGHARAVTLVPSVGADADANSYFSLIDLNISRLAKALR